MNILSEVRHILKRTGVRPLGIVGAFRLEKRGNPYPRKP